MSLPIHATAGNHPTQRDLDHCEPPPCAVEALLRVKPLPAAIWDPCAAGAIVGVLKARGHRVVANDLSIDGIDFLQRREAQAGVDAVLTNPRVLAPHEKFPGLKALNDRVPKSEWRTNFNASLVGPWQAQHVLFFLDERTLDRYSFPTSTIGGNEGWP